MTWLWLIIVCSGTEQACVTEIRASLLGWAGMQPWYSPGGTEHNTQGVVSAAQCTIGTFLSTAFSSAAGCTAPDAGQVSHPFDGIEGVDCC